MKAKLLAMAFAALLSLSFAASVLGATPEEMSGMYGGDFTIAVKDPALELNPKLATDDASWNIIDLLYDSLGRMDPVTLEVVPWVAESWTVEGDDVTVVLKPSAVWHDGSAVTASDVEYTYEMFYTGYSVNVVSPTEAVFTFASGGGMFMTEGLQKPLVKSQDSSPSQGCGAFELLDRVAGDHVTIGAYDGYFEGRPYLDTIEFIVYPDMDTAAVDLMDQTIDMIGWTLSSTDPTDIRSNNKTILDQPHLAVVNNPGFEFLYFGFNPIDELTSEELRVALAMLVNKDLYASVEPNTFVTHSPMTKYNGYWYSTSLVKYNAGYFFDATGRQSTNYYAGLHELERLGYFDRDCDGWREAPDGSSVSMTMLGPSINDDLRKNTMAMDYRVLLSNMDLDITMSTTGDPATFDIVLGMGELGLEPSAIRDLPMLADYTFGDLDAALDAADDALDRETRQMYVHEAQNLISTHVPFVPILMYDAIEAYNRVTFTGWVDMTGGINNFWSFTDLHMIRSGSLTISVETSVAAVDSGGNATVTVRVLDSTGGSVEGANVELSADVGAFLLGTGTTDSLGEFQTTFTAPAASDVADIEIMATTFLATYEGATASTKITVHPVVSTLMVTVGRQTSVLESGASTTVTVVITDQDLIPVDGCAVYMVVDHAGATLGSPTPVAGSPGQFTASFTGNVTTDTSFKVTVTAVKDGSETGTGFTNVLVRSWGGVEPPQIEKIESIPDVGILAMISVTLVALLVIAYRRREH
ncbi:MAG: ABC transporter substrate-binding protein [Candidatus Thermoplasmatota archaeon]|nr:ABC transporter substrate-binding protein [Candidatus Thermoplasmatota archaeon]